MPLAHELTHIRNRDTQLMVIAVIFAGIFAFFGDLLIRAWDFRYGWSPTPRGRPRSETSYPNGGAAGRSRAGPGPAILAMAIAVAIVLISWGLSILIRFALSRSREFLADAGSAELTKNPDALVSALRKIHANARLEVPSRMDGGVLHRQPSVGPHRRFLSDHPSIEARIEALRRYAGAAAPT